jgi:hypothetical protein
VVAKLKLGTKKMSVIHQSATNSHISVSSRQNQDALMRIRERYGQASSRPQGSGRVVQDRVDVCIRPAFTLTIKPVPNNLILESLQNLYVSG